MQVEDLAEPLTAVESAKLLDAATLYDSQLSAAGVMLLRRALFQIDAQNAKLKALQKLVNGYREQVGEYDSHLNRDAKEMLLGNDQEIEDILRGKA